MKKAFDRLSRLERTCGLKDVTTETSKAEKQREKDF
jgi:hypothetical protein